MNANNEVTLHRSEILPQSEIEYPIKLQGSNNDKSTVETIIKNYEHHPSIKLIKEHIEKENNDFNIKAAGVIEAVVKRCSVKRCSWKFHKINRKTPVPESPF